jgi:hypothetical protein
MLEPSSSHPNPKISPGLSPDACLCSYSVNITSSLPGVLASGLDYAVVVSREGRGLPWKGVFFPPKPALFRGRGCRVVVGAFRGPVRGVVGRSGVGADPGVCRWFLTELPGSGRVQAV